MTAQLLFCAAASMLRLPPAILVSGRILLVLPRLSSPCYTGVSDWIKDPKIVNIPKMVYQETPPVKDSGWDSSADVGELLLAPVRPGGAVCPPDWSPTRRSTTWPRNSSTSRRPRCPWQAHFFRKEFTVFFLTAEYKSWLPVAVCGGMEDWWPVQSSSSRHWNALTTWPSEVIR